MIDKLIIFIEYHIIQYSLKSIFNKIYCLDSFNALNYVMI